MWGKKKKQEGQEQKQELATKQQAGKAEELNQAIGPGLSRTIQEPEVANVFEFGGTVKAGELALEGVCPATDPDSVQACSWSIRPVKKEANKYHIEF